DVPEYNWTWLDTENQLKMLSMVDEEDREIIRFLMLHGCRPGEARALKVKNLDLKTNSIRIDSTFSDSVIREKRKGRNSKHYIIPIHPEMLEYLQYRCNNSLPEAFVFINPRSGKHYADACLDGVWNKARKKACAPKLRLYDATRHSLGSGLANQNVSPFIISKILGHTTVKMSERYMHHDIDSLRVAFDKVSLEKKVSEIKPKKE
ncbi:MAG: tyrosine-type recombinase/integrase, partial [Nitrospirae bacterium]|nr:tyrosine-type recombinase/integrase [Nitrospirota bacterium]